MRIKSMYLMGLSWGQKVIFIKQPSPVSGWKEALDKWGSIWYTIKGWFKVTRLLPISYSVWPDSVFPKSDRLGVVGGSSDRRGVVAIGECIDCPFLFLEHSSESRQGCWQLETIGPRSPSWYKLIPVYIFFQALQVVWMLSWLEEHCVVDSFGGDFPTATGHQSPEP